MKKLLLLLLLFTTPVFGQAWVKTHTALRTIYATSNSNFGKLLESVTANYMGLEDDPAIRTKNIEMVSGAQGNAVSITGNTCTGACDEPYAQLYYADTLDDTTWSVSWWFNSSSAVTGNMWASWATSDVQLSAVVNCNVLNTGQVSCLVREDNETANCDADPELENCAENFTITSTGPDKTNGSWHHAVLVAEAANIHRLYIDGVLNVSNTTTTIGATTEMGALVLNPNGSSVYLGNYIGLIDEFHVYSDAKNAANVTTLYNAGTPLIVPLSNATTVYHFNEDPPGLDTDHRIDLDDINGWIRPGDEVLLEAVSPDPGYLSDRAMTDIDFSCEVSHPSNVLLPWIERFCYLGPWYTLLTSGTETNPILFKCEGDWPSDCRFHSRLESEGDFQWVWGMWFTGPNANNTQDCKTSDNGPGGGSISGRGSAMINNWFYHPANYPLIVAIPTSQPYKSDLDRNFDFEAYFLSQGYTRSYAPTTAYDGYVGGGLSQRANGPEVIWYGNILNGGGHGVYAQNNYFNSGYAYFVQNMYQNNGESVECDPAHNPGNMTTPGKLAGYWSTNNEVQGFYLKNNFYADMEGEVAGEFFHASQGEPSQYSFIDSNEIFCSGRMVTPPSNGRISTGSATVGHPHAFTFTNNFAASCSINFQYWWGTGEVLYDQEVPNIFTGNTILVDPTISNNVWTLNTSAYRLCAADCESILNGPGTDDCVIGVGSCREPEGYGRLQATDIIDNNTYTTGSTFTAHWDGCFATGQSPQSGTCNDFDDMTLAEWRTESAAAGKAFDVNSTTITYPVTGSRVVLYKNEYDPTIGNLMIYNWAEAETVDVNFTAVCPLCSRFDLYDADGRPDDTPVLSNVVNTGALIPVPMDGDLVKLFRIHILSGE